jgi:hypothetical protein
VLRYARTQSLLQDHIRSEFHKNMVALIPQSVFTLLIKTVCLINKKYFAEVKLAAGAFVVLVIP